MGALGCCRSEGRRCRAAARVGTGGVRPGSQRVGSGELSKQTWGFPPLAGTALSTFCVRPGNRRVGAGTAAGSVAGLRTCSVEDAARPWDEGWGKHGRMRERGDCQQGVSAIGRHGGAMRG